MKQFLSLIVLLIGLQTATNAQPGTLDPSFGTSGKVLTDFTGGNDLGWSSVLLPDGKIVAGGSAALGTYDFALVKYNANGTTDPGFGTAGKVTLDLAGKDDFGIKLLLQTDNKLLLCGYTFNGTDNDFAVVRLNADGTLDSGFGTGGKVVLPVGPEYDKVNGAALQPDGRIVIVGVSGQYYPNQDVAVIRLNSDGSTDNTFGTGGLRVLNLGPWSEEARDVSVLADGKLMITGYINDDPALYHILLLKLNEDGSSDSSFGTNGVLVAGGSLNACDGYGIRVLPDGRYYIAGVEDVNNSYNFVLARFLSDGSPDSSFGTAGIVTTDFSTYDMAKCLLVLPDSSIVIAGYSGTWPLSDFCLARYDKYGNHDTSFGNGGVILTDFGGLYDLALALLLQPDGKIIAAGYGSNGSNYDFALARYHSGLSLTAGTVANPVLLETGPNPVRDRLTIRASSAIVKLDLYSLHGTLLLTERAESPVHVIDVASLPAGQYLLSVETLSGNCTRMVTRP